jgi:hypothetical protein
MGDRLRHGTLHRNKLSDIFAGVLALGPQLSEPQLPLLRRGDLRD